MNSRCRNLITALCAAYYITGSEAPLFRKFMKFFLPQRYKTPTVQANSAGALGLSGPTAKGLAAAHLRWLQRDPTVLYSPSLRWITLNVTRLCPGLFVN